MTERRRPFVPKAVTHGLMKEALANAERQRQTKAERARRRARAERCLAYGKRVAAWREANRHRTGRG